MRYFSEKKSCKIRPMKGTPLLNPKFFILSINFFRLYLYLIVMSEKVPTSGSEILTPKRVL